MNIHAAQRNGIETSPFTQGATRRAPAKGNWDAVLKIILEVLSKNDEPLRGGL